MPFPYLNFTLSANPFVEAEEEAEIEDGEEKDDEAAQEARHGVGPIAAGQEPAAGREVSEEDLKDSEVKPEIFMIKRATPVHIE